MIPASVSIAASLRRNHFIRSGIGQLMAYCLLLLFSCNHTNNKTMSSLTAYPFRLKPGQDLKQEIQNFVNSHSIKAGWISTCAGSLTKYAIRFANQPNNSVDSGHFEIVSLTGTVSMNGSHLHLSISDSTGKTIGGHLSEGCIIYTTAEIVILATDDYNFTRKKDGTTPWEELQVEEEK
ncbi:MAG: PPC domain-containing DNA-binding protein [Ferruginibacter sp.]